MRRKTVLAVMVMLALLLGFGASGHSELSKGMITLTFDDGYSSVYTQAFPALNTYGFKGTAYIISDYAGYYGYAVSWTQLQALSNTYGWEIGNHTMDHPSLLELTDAEIIDQIRGARSALESHGLINVTSFAYPYGDYDQHVIDLLAQDGTLYSARAAWWEDYPINTVDNFNQWAVITIGADYPEDFDSIKPYIDQAISEKGWVVLMMHNVVTTSPSEYETARTELNRIVQYVYQQRSGLEVVTMSQGVAKMLTAQSLQLLAMPSLLQSSTVSKGSANSKKASAVAASKEPPANIRVKGARE